MPKVKSWYFFNLENPTHDKFPRSIKYQDLMSLEGLESIPFLDNCLCLRTNENLEDISAIENMDLSALDYLDIISNKNLSICSYGNICSYIQTEKVFLSRNDVGCMDTTEVRIGCENPYNRFERSNGFWDKPNHWSLGSVPDACSHVIIPSDKKCTIKNNYPAKCESINVSKAGELVCPVGSELIVAPK